MGSTTLISLCLVAASSLGQTLSDERIDDHNARFQRLWNSELVWKFDQLPEKGSVPEFRVPYSGHIYLDRNGGTINSLRKYDQAFNDRRYPATKHEQWDTTAFRKTRVERVGLFGLGSRTVSYTPHWHGHCNGWTAASIRHAEPKQSVTRNGVTFTPADIKGLLAEIYIYQDTEDIGGEYGEVNAAELHVALTNWIGMKSHPIGMEADPGKEKWNYPVYGYASSHSYRGSNRVEVKTNIRYAKYSEGEFQESPRIARDKYFHYELYLNDSGEITGGRYFRGSSRLDLLWVAGHPKPGGQEGNKRGNPYIDMEKVLSIWRDSVPAETVDQWVMIESHSPEAIPEVETVAAAETENDVVDPSVSLETRVNETPNPTDSAAMDSGR